MRAAVLHVLASGTSGVEIIAWIVIPLTIFVIGGTFTGVSLLVKGSAYMAKSQAAQEQTAKSNQDIADTLAKYAEKTDGRLNGIDIRVSVLEAAKSPLSHRGQGGG
jgi:hypothetical protein